jgi:hypothetical protein
VSATFEPALIVLGLLLCLFGWTLYWAGLRLLGAVCGAIAFTALVGIVMIFGGWERWLWIGCGSAAVVGAIVGIYLITRAHYILFFITGAVAGLTTASVLQSVCLEWVQTYVPGMLGQVAYYASLTLVGGLLVLLAHRMVVTTLTAFAGTVVFSFGVPQTYAIYLFLPLFFLSLLVQSGILYAIGDKGKGEEKKGGDEGKK